MATKGKWAKKDKDYELKDYHKDLTDKMIFKLEDAIKWNKPWVTCSLLPYNPVTGTKYKGINQLALMAAEFSDARFLTHNNIKELSEKLGKPMHIKKGEKGIPVFKAVNFVVNDGEEEVGSGDQAQPGVTRSFWKQVYAGTVFNATQIEGMEPLVAHENKVVDHAEIEALTAALMARTNLQVVHGEGGAYYSPARHMVNMPPKELFKSTAAYYSTLLHEETHATGPALGRDLSGNFGSDSYRKEELVAEFGSYFLGAELGVPYDSTGHDNHAAYMQSWLGMMKEDKNLIFWAASKGSRATEYQLDHLKEHKLELEMKKDWILEKVVAPARAAEMKKQPVMSM